MSRILKNRLIRFALAIIACIGLTAVLPATPANAAAKGKCTLSVLAVWPGDQIGGNESQIQCNTVTKVTLYMRTTKYWSIWSESKTKTYSWGSFNSYVKKELPISLDPPVQKLYASSQVCWDYSGTRHCLNKDDWLIY